jgi:SM-20-related protein
MELCKSPLIIDEFIDEETFELVAQMFQEASWKFGWRSNTVGDASMHWNKHFAGGGKSTRRPCDDELASNGDARPVWHIWTTIKEKLLPEHVLLRCYGNAHTFGLDGSIHKDNPDDVNMVTTLVYCHRLWPLPWGGETLFYSDDCENIDTIVFPKPGRLVVFPGNIPHAARSPTRVCRDLRISLVFKSIKSHELHSIDR